MPIVLDGFNTRRNESLEDLGADLSVSVGAQASQMFVENPFNSMLRFSELEGQQRGSFVPGTQGGQFAGPESEIVTKENADKRISEQGVSLDIGTNGIATDALETMITRKREEMKRKAVISAAPSGFWSGAAMIGTGLAVSIADPINIASAFIPVVGQSRYVRLLAGASGASGRAGVRTAVGAASGAVGAAFVEPIVLAAAESEQADYGLYNSFLNITFGAILGGGLHSGAGAIGDAIRKTAATSQDNMLRAAVSQTIEGRPVDVGYIAAADPEFRSQWIESNLDEITATTKAAEIDKIRAELQAEIRASDSIAAPNARQINDDLSQLSKGIVPERFEQRIIDSASERLETGLGVAQARSLDTAPPRIEPDETTAPAIASNEAQQTVDNAMPETPESVDTLTNDILDAADELGEDTAVMRAEVEQLNVEAERDAAGLREAVMCRIGR